MLIDSADGVIKLHTVNADLNRRPRVLKGHEGYVLQVAFDPLREFLASFGADGTFRIWKVDNDRYAIGLALRVLLV